MDKMDIMRRHWFNHNRDPFKSQNLFTDQLNRVSHVNVHVLAKAVDLLASEDVFPKIKKLLYHCTVLTPQAETGTVDCNICDGMGLVLGVVFVKDGACMDVVSYDHKVRYDGNYSTRIIGRCECENGLAYQHVNETALGKVVNPDQFQVDAANDKGWSASFEASQAAIHFNHKQRGRMPQKASGPLAKLITQIEEKQIEEEV